MPCIHKDNALYWKNVLYSQSLCLVSTKTVPCIHKVDSLLLLPFNGLHRSYSKRLFCCSLFLKIGGGLYFVFFNLWVLDKGCSFVLLELSWHGILMFGQLFSLCGDVLRVTIAKKKDMKNPGSDLFITFIFCICSFYCSSSSYLWSLTGTSKKYSLNIRSCLIIKHVRFFILFYSFGWGRQQKSKGLT